MNIHIDQLNSICSLENLTNHYMEVLYKTCHNMFNLNELKVHNIKKSVEAGTYCFSKLRADLVTSDVKLDPRVNHIINCKDVYPGCFIVITPEESDLFVFTALGLLINELFVEMGIKSLNMTNVEFYDSLSSRSNVDLLYRMDFSSTLLSYDKEKLKKKLESVLGKTPIFDLVMSFLSLDINNDSLFNGKLNSKEIIPPVSLLSDIILNFILNDLDNEMVNNYPSIN